MQLNTESVRRCDDVFVLPGSLKRLICRWMLCGVDRADQLWATKAENIPVYANEAWCEQVFFLINKPAKLSDYKTFLIRCNAMFAKRNSSARTWGNVDALEFSFPCSRLHERVGREAFRVSPANWRGSPRSDEIFKSEKWICPFSDLVKVLNVDLEIILKLENSLKKMHSEICPWKASHVVLVTLQKKKSRAKSKKIFRRNWRAS